MNHLKQVYRGLLITLAFVQLLGLLFSVQTGDVTARLGLIILILGLPTMAKTFRWATIIFFAAGVWLLIANNEPLMAYADAINSMLEIVVLLIVMQLFMVPIEMGHYREAVAEFIDARLHTPRAIYVFVMVVTNLLSSILSMGTVPIVFSILGGSLQKRVVDYNKFSSNAITRAFIMGTLWAPGAATIFLICSVTKVSWSRLFLPSIILAIWGLTISYLLEYRKSYLTRGKPVQAVVGKPRLHSTGRLAQILLAVVILLGLSFLLIHLSVGSAMQSVTVAGLVTVIGWIGLLLVLRRQTTKVRPAMAQYWSKGVLSGGALAPFFAAIGTFSYAFEHSHLETVVSSWLQPVFATTGWGIVVIIPILVVLMALIGIHPLASIALLGKLVMTVHTVVPTLMLALSLNIGGAVAYMISPFAGIIIIVANLLHINAAKISISWNWQFCTIFTLTGLLIAVGCQYIF